MNKMGKKWKTIEPGVWKPEQKGDAIEGRLVNKVPRDDTKSMSAKYYVDNESGIQMVWGSAILEDRMAYVKVGQYIRITYNGQDKNKKGQKVNLFQVDVADEDEQAEQPESKAASATDPEPVPIEDI